MKTNFLQRLQQIFCVHIKDYVGYIVYPTFRKGSNRKLFNIDYIHICPKCGKLFSWRKPVMKGLSRTRCAEIIKRLRQGGYIVVVRDEENH